ncbi:hypothetical protein A3I58_00130 [Candidatus Peregrinibacteria bacterium RIFCSPLOWO2_02_FULL_39_10]|nr:MAG: hypothetical protein A3I58_00130 [Candidatus Peregrinibacteria bacterium RIFCSPLOWO2_02_FULL_39_10]
MPQATSIQHLKWEKEFLGLYVSGHPLRGLKSYIAKKANLIGELTQKQVGKTVKVLGMITNLKKVLTKNGGYMATFVIEDPSGKVNGIMFPKALAHYGAELNEDLIIGFNGKLDHRRSQYQVICDTAKVLSLDTMMENAKKSRLYKPDDKSDIVIRLLDDILTEDLEAIVPGIEGKSINVIENFDVGDVCDCAKNDSYLIEIPASADNEIMTSLKDLLMKHRGDTDVELYLSNVKRRIKLPFKIKISDELKADIDSLLVAN